MTVSAVAPDLSGRPGLVPVTTLSRRDAAIAEIRRGIVLGALRPGEKLTELSLAGTLGVSRATVREALSQLAREGLVTVEPYRGLRVADLDHASLRDLARTRVSLDLLAVRDILADPGGERLAAVRTAWTAFETTVHDADPIVRHEGHLAFHRAIWTASENTLLAQLWPVIEAHMTIALAQDQAVRPGAERARQTHADLVAAIESRDLAAVEAALTTHIITSADELIALRTSERTAT